ncbi:MAG: hypothetical protein KUG65_11620 [Sphingomonadaceae bacterium]|nr:hypothetical protein [Sphingomonadaceae bacterium]
MNEDTAKTRWMVIQAVRWTGMGLFLLGLLIYADKIELPKIAGYIFMGVGLLDALFMPSVLARMWKTPL